MKQTPQQKLTDQNYQLAYHIKELEEERARLLAMLTRIEQAKTYKLWQSLLRWFNH